MKNLEKYKGVFPAFYACFNDDGSVSYDRTAAFAQMLYKKGVKGLYVNGSSGECIYLDKEERKIIIRAVMDAVGDKLTIINHVACNNTRDSMELASDSEKLGVDAIAAIPPIYFKLPDAAIAKYWNDISSAAPGTDFFIYNIPQLAGVALSLPLFKKMRENKNVIGVKNSSMPVMDIEMFKAEGGDDCIIFNGPDEQFVSGRIIGADGGIGGTYAVMPELFLKADEYLKNGDFQKATELQRDIDTIIYALCAGPAHMLSICKHIIKLQGLDIGEVRSPLTQSEKTDLENAEKIKILIENTIQKYQ